MGSSLGLCRCDRRGDGQFERGDGRGPHRWPRGQFWESHFPELSYFTLFAPMAVVLLFGRPGFLEGSEHAAKMFESKKMDVYALGGNHPCLRCASSCLSNLCCYLIDPELCLLHRCDEPGRADRLHESRGSRACRLFCDRGLYDRYPGDEVSRGVCGQSLLGDRGGAGALLILAFLSLRAAGIYFLLITMADCHVRLGPDLPLGIPLREGITGLSAYPRPDLGLPWNLLDPVYFYYFILVFFIICFVLIFTFWSGLPSGGRWWGSGTAKRG